MTTYIALLRGINLGPLRRVSMTDLRCELTTAGFEHVRTYLQSGNVVLAAEETTAEALARELEELVAGRLGVETSVVVRTRDELAAVVERNPLGDVADDPKRHQVSFLSAPPADTVVRDLLAADVAPGQVAVDGREVHAWHPGGIQRSPLGRLLSDRRLGVTATARNWTTVTALLALADDPPA